METRKIRLEYALDKVGAPVFSQLVSTFNVEPNVLAADISATSGGWLILSVTGTPEQLDKALAWVEQNGIHLSAA